MDDKSIMDNLNITLLQAETARHCTGIYNSNQAAILHDYVQAIQVHLCFSVSLLKRNL